jgi:WD40 repeat protein
MAFASLPPAMTTQRRSGTRQAGRSCSPCAVTLFRSRVFTSAGMEHVATASADDTAEVWDATSGQRLLTLRGHSDSVEGVAFSPDGTLLTTASADHTAKVWNAFSGQEMLTLRGRTREVWSVAFSPDGKRVATAKCGPNRKGLECTRWARVPDLARPYRPGARYGLQP